MIEFCSFKIMNLKLHFQFVSFIMLIFLGDRCNVYLHRGLLGVYFCDPNNTNNGLDTKLDPSTEVSQVF